MNDRDSEVVGVHTEVKHVFSVTPNFPTGHLQRELLETNKGRTVEPINLIRTSRKTNVYNSEIREK